MLFGMHIILVLMVHCPLLTIGAEPRLHLGLVDAVLDLLDLMWMIGKERELGVVVVFLGALHSISSHDSLLS